MDLVYIATLIEKAKLWGHALDTPKNRNQNRPDQSQWCGLLPLFERMRHSTPPSRSRTRLALHSPCITYWHTKARWSLAAQMICLLLNHVAISLPGYGLRKLVRLALVTTLDAPKGCFNLRLNVSEPARSNKSLR